jgi:hypothetical protein
LKNLGLKKKKLGLEGLETQKLGPGRQTKIFATPQSHQQPKSTTFVEMPSKRQRVLLWKVTSAVELRRPVKLTFTYF